MEVLIAVTTMPCISLSEWRQRMMHRLFGTTSSHIPCEKDQQRKNLIKTDIVIPQRI